MRTVTLVGEMVTVIAAGGGVTGGVVAVVCCAWPESAEIISPETSTASKSDPWILPRLCKSSLLQRESGAPERYQAEPLSAIIIPYFLSASRMIWLVGEKLEISKSARSRKRTPMGGYCAPVRLDA